MRRHRCPRRRRRPALEPEGPEAWNRLAKRLRAAEWDAVLAGSRAAIGPIAGEPVPTRDRHPS